LSSFKEDIVSLIRQSKDANEEEYRRQSGLLMQGLRKVQAQLDTQAATLERIEQGVEKLYTSVDSGMRDIGHSLQSNADDLAELKDLHSCWKDAVSLIENSMEKKDSAGIETAFDAFKGYFESYADSLTESLRDSMSEEFADMKEKVLQGDERVLAELRAVQAQLTEVLTLGKETRDKLAQGLKMLLSGRADLLATSKLAGYDAIRELKLNSDDFNVAMVLSAEQLCYAFSRQMPDSEITLFQQALTLALASEAYRKLQAKYLPVR
jgi:hypothetical protein